MTDTAQNTIFRPGHGHCELPLGFSLTELGPLPDHWTVAPLSSVINEVDRTAAETVTDPNELPVLSLTKNDGLILQTERFGKRIATNDVRKYKVVRRSQIVYNPYVIWEGAVHMLRHYEIGLVSPVYVVWQAKENAEPEYIDHLLRTPLAITAYNRLAAGAVNRRRSIRKNDFLAIQIPLPPLDEQKAIARVLRTLRRAAEATNSVIGAAHELKNSLMRHLFSFGPLAVHEAAKRVLNEGSVGAISEHWGVGAIGDYITECQYGLNIRGLPAARYAILRMNNLQDGRIDAHDLKYVDLDARSLEKFHLKSGDLLFNRTNSARPRRKDRSLRPERRVCICLLSDPLPG